MGYRRNKCFSLSNDYGENWTRIEPDVPFDFLYQPYLLALDGGRLGLYGHVGGDNAFGENDMTIQAQVFAPECARDMPARRAALAGADACAGRERIYQFVPRTPDGGRRPLAGQEVEFPASTPYWNRRRQCKHHGAGGCAGIKNRYARTRKAGPVAFRQCATTASETYTWPTMWT